MAECWWLRYLNSSKWALGLVEEAKLKALFKKMVTVCQARKS